MGGGLRRPPARVPIVLDPRNPMFGVVYVGKNMYLGRMSEEARFPYMVYTHYLCSCSTG